MHAISRRPLHLLEWLTRSEKVANNEEFDAGIPEIRRTLQGTHLQTTLSFSVWTRILVQEVNDSNAPSTSRRTFP